MCDTHVFVYLDQLVVPVRMRVFVLDNHVCVYLDHVGVCVLGEHVCV